MDSKELKAMVEEMEKEETEEVDPTEVEPEEVEEETAEVEEDTEGEESDTIPAFMASEEDEEDEPEEEGKATSGTVKAIAKQREKRRKAEEEVERLRKENEELRKGLQPQPAELGPKPKIDDFDSDEKYEAALDEWYDKKHKAGTSQAQQETTQKQAYERLKKQLDTAYDAHLDRADALVKEHKIKPEVFKSAEDAVIDVIGENAGLPDDADKKGVAEHILKKFVDVVGDGSEKVIYYLGVNRKAQREFATMLAGDNSGLKATAWMARKVAELQGTTTKKRSSAPAPDTEIRGEKKGEEQDKVIKKRFDEAKNKDLTAALAFRRDAKKLGIDVSDWG